MGCRLGASVPDGNGDMFAHLCWRRQRWSSYANDGQWLSERQKVQDAIPMPEPKPRRYGIRDNREYAKEPGKSPKTYTAKRCHQLPSPDSPISCGESTRRALWKGGSGRLGGSEASAADQGGSSGQAGFCLEPCDALAGVGARRSPCDGVAICGYTQERRHSC